jgi:hypothetical protein
MAPRPEELSSVAEVTVHLVDMEPVAGLVAAVARFCAHLDEETIKIMPVTAVEALSAIQTIMWNLEHSRPETVTHGP